METEIETYGKQIAQCLAKTMRIEPYSLCFCGSGKKYKFCCSHKSGAEMVFGKNVFKKAIQYRDSQGGKVETIPLGIIKLFQKASLARLTCLYPKCDNQPVSCHLVPENILRKNFGNFCKEFAIQDTSPNGGYVKTGINRAGTQMTFCSRHDNDLFQCIDTLSIDFANSEHLFLLALKAIAFSLRRTQYLLGIDYQVEIMKPILISQRAIGLAGHKLSRTLDISYLHTQYIRFCTAHETFLKAIVAYEKGRWDVFSHLYRKMECKEKIFFAGYLNPSHDLNGVKLNDSRQSISMTCNVFSDNTHLHALFSCPDAVSKRSYLGFFDQISKTDEKEFVAVLNNTMTLSSEKPLLSEDFEIPESELCKIDLLRQRAERALKGDVVLSLANVPQCVQFVSC